MSIQQFIDHQITMNMSPFIGLLDSIDSEALPNEYVELISHSDVDGEPVEILEYWGVSEWLALQLQGRKEAVSMNFNGMPTWGRTTSGQAIKLDSVIRDIYQEHYA
ncbi:hypothetical protein [Aquimarina algiphila]|uniref:Uncharacterized protein n=1 Tax=Aquimarina algiphila TaxID=2047982 RepID=A0A554VIE3_9FLAO|nr:hypothetical protein [Aquimarina algiphila]TSE07425.1 hypothetical protein FOF46_16035 [Aquimarina algiphila]